MDSLGERLARGDAAAFAEVYDTFADRLHHYLTVRLGSRHEAEDVLQDVFVRLVRTRGRLAGVKSVAAYLFTMARNEAARFGTRKAGDARHRSSLKVEELFQVARDDAPAREAAELVAVGLATLSAAQREVVHLKAFGGLTFREIAAVTGVPLPTAAARYAAALQRLKDWLVRQTL